MNSTNRYKNKYDCNILDISRPEWAELLDELFEDIPERYLNLIIYMPVIWA